MCFGIHYLVLFAFLIPILLYCLRLAEGADLLL
jgi:hypothetical protein